MIKIENDNDKQIIISYISVVLMCSWFFAFLIFSNPSVGLSKFGLVMFFPAIVALLFNRLVYRKSTNLKFGSIFTRPNLKSIIFGIGYPLIFIATCGVISLVTGFGYFNSGKYSSIYIIISSIVTILVNLIFVFGEEYGWRGYLLPKLTRITGKKMATVIFGVFWALYHFPFVYFLAKTTGIGSPLLIATIQAIDVFFFTFAFSYSYYISKGSLIPVMFFHSTWNTINVLVLGDIYTNKSGLITGNILFINGEGVLGSIISGILVFWFIKQFDKSEKYTNEI